MQPVETDQPSAAARLREGQITYRQYLREIRKRTDESLRRAREAERQAERAVRTASKRRKKSP